MESTVINSFKAGVNRMQGTLLGAVIGLAFSSIKRNSPVLCALGTIIIIVVCNKFKWKKAVVISCTVFYAIMINLSQKTPFEYSFNRLLDTSIGIIISVVVNYLIFAPKIHERVEDLYLNIRYNIEDKMRFLIKNHYIEELGDLRGLLDKYNSLTKSLEQETVIYREEDISDDMERHISSLKYFEMIYIYFEALSMVNYNRCCISKENLEALEIILGDKYNYNLDNTMNNEENIIYNYNIKKIIQAFKSA